MKPEKEIKRGERILKTLYPEGFTPLTVGDLSVVSAEKKKRKKPAEDDSDDDLASRLESVYVGPRPSDFQPSTSQSQRIDRSRLEKHGIRVRKRFLIKNPSVPNAMMEQMVLQK